jgi:hypothetical protein
VNVLPNVSCHVKEVPRRPSRESRVRECLQLVAEVWRKQPQPDVRRMSRGCGGEHDLYPVCPVHRMLPAELVHPPSQSLCLDVRLADVVAAPEEIRKSRLILTGIVRPCTRSYTVPLTSQGGVANGIDSHH